MWADCSKQLLVGDAGATCIRLVGAAGVTTKKQCVAVHFPRPQRAIAVWLHFNNILRVILRKRKGIFEMNSYEKWPIPCS